MGGRSNLAAILILMFVFVMAGCSSVKSESADMIGRPLNITTPIEGSWRIGSCINGISDDENAMSIEDTVAGNVLQFSPDKMAFGSNEFENISYKIKRVKADEYFLHKNQEVYAKMSLKGGELFVITVYSQDKFLYEFIKDSQGKILLNMDERYYLLESIDDDVFNAAKQDERTAVASISRFFEEEDSQTQSGLLLAVREPSGKVNGSDEYKYVTYWIAFVDDAIRPVLYADDIYLPRMDGFWKLKMEKRPLDFGYEDIIVAWRVPKRDSELIPKFFNDASVPVETTLKRTIQYVGNDYICVENTIAENQGGGSEKVYKKTLRTLPVDNLDKIDGIKISDLVGANAAIAVEDAVKETLRNLGGRKIEIENISEQEQNFSLYRKTGHWFFKGRLNYVMDGQNSYTDFNINAIPPSDMVAYDTLHIPWTYVKDTIPEASDIYTSPNNDIAVVLTGDEILVYEIGSENTLSNILTSMPLSRGSSVIMAEWATGDYVMNWEKSFIKNNDTKQYSKND